MVGSDAAVHFIVLFALGGQAGPLALHLLAVKYQELFLAFEQPLLADEFGFTVGDLLFLLFDVPLLLADRSQ